MKRKTTTSKLPKEIITAIYKKDLDKLEEFALSDELESADIDKRTAVFHAVLAKDSTVLKLLISHGAKVNLKDKLGWTPLHYAVQNYDSLVVDVLLDNNVELDAKDDHGNTALWRAVFESKGKGEMIKLLLSKGAKANIKNNAGISPLKLANTIANYDVKQFFEEG